MFRLHNKIMAISVPDDKSGRNVTFKDLCYRTPEGECDDADGYLYYWFKDFNRFLTEVGGSEADPRQGSEAVFRDRVSQIEYPDGQ